MAHRRTSERIVCLPRRQVNRFVPLLRSPAGGRHRSGDAHGVATETRLRGAILPPHAGPRIRRRSALARSGRTSYAALLPPVGDLALHRARSPPRGIRLRPHHGRSARPPPLARRLARASRRARHGDARGHGPGAPVGASTLRDSLGRRRERGRLGALARRAGPGLELTRRGAESPHSSWRDGADRRGARGRGRMGARQRGGDATPGVDYRRLSGTLAPPRDGSRPDHRGARRASRGVVRRHAGRPPRPSLRRRRGARAGRICHPHARRGNPQSLARAAGGGSAAGRGGIGQRGRDGTHPCRSAYRGRADARQPFTERRLWTVHPRSARLPRAGYGPRLDHPRPERARRYHGAGRHRPDPALRILVCAGQRPVLR